MGVYIKGVEMPITCESCPCKTADAFGGLGCQATGYIPLRKANQDRPDNCPLVPVPPHGRLIDVDAIRADIDEKRPGRSYEDAWALTVMDAAPTIIPAKPAEEGE